MMFCKDIKMQQFLKNENIHIISITMYDNDKAADSKCSNGGFKMQIYQPSHFMEQNGYLLLKIPNLPNDKDTFDM